jgi:hypothetical protein
MAHSLLLQEGIGIGLERREEIVFDAHSQYVDTFPENNLEGYGFTSTVNFDNASLDFDARLLPEAYPDIDVHDTLFQSFTNISDRLLFLQGVASSIMLSRGEVEVCADILGVRPAILQAATEAKPVKIRQLPPFLVVIEGQLAS